MPWMPGVAAGAVRRAGLRIVERDAGAPDGRTIGLANIAADVPGIEANKEKILAALDVFIEHGVNIAVFPEFCLSGYFWDGPDCLPYMEEAVTENHLGWLEEEVRGRLGGPLRLVVMNNITRGTGALFRNTTFLVSDAALHDLLDDATTYDKVFLPGIEKRFTESGRDDRLVVRSPLSGIVVGFTTCYDYLFQDLLREYKYFDEVNLIVQLASWRAASVRDYPGLNKRTDQYYGLLWDTVIPAFSATNQLWTVACNAVGRHPISGAEFWGGSGIWAPSGMCLVQASRHEEELLIVHGLELESALKVEQDDFDYEFDFREIYRPMGDGRTLSRQVDL